MKEKGEKMVSVCEFQTLKRSSHEFEGSDHVNKRLRLWSKENYLPLLKSSQSLLAHRALSIVIQQWLIDYNNFFDRRWVSLKVNQSMLEKQIKSVMHNQEQSVVNSQLRLIEIVIEALRKDPLDAVGVNYNLNYRNNLSNLQVNTLIPSHLMGGKLTMVSVDIFCSISVFLILFE
jgi:hypothetical protein